MKDARFSKFVIFTNALVPLGMLLWDVYHKRVGANPLEFVTRTTGMLTLVFLMITLAVTPARKITGLNWLVKFRRMLGLFAFFYGFLHLMTYIWFDRYFNLKSVPGDIVSRPFIAIGMLAFFLMVAARNNLDQQDDQAFGRKTLEQAAQADLRRRHRGRASLLAARQIRHTSAADFWLHSSAAAGLSAFCEVLPARQSSDRSDAAAPRITRCRFVQRMLQLTRYQNRER